MKTKKILALILAVIMSLALVAACGSGDDGGTSTPRPADSGQTTTSGGSDPVPAEELKVFTMLVLGAGEASPYDNKIIKKIEEITGVRIEFEYTVGDVEQKAGVVIASGDYTDLIGPGQMRGRMLNAGALLDVSEYIVSGQYPNLQRHFGPYEAKMRTQGDDDGIYLLDNWGRNYWLEDGEDDLYFGDYNAQAYWIQKDVLVFNNYVVPETLDELFDLLERYYQANPEIDGLPTLPFEILSQTWRSFCLKNPPQHLVGGRNEGDVVVWYDRNYEVEIYQNKWYAKKLYEIYNDAYKRGLINPETFTRTEDQYNAVIAQGRVLCMFDAQWAFGGSEGTLVNEGRLERTYVPLGPKFEKSDPPLPYGRVVTFRNDMVGNGMGISVNCHDVEGAIAFLDALLDEEVQKLLYWGIEGEDYYVDENGRYRRTPEQKQNFDNPDWRLANAGGDFAGNFPKIQGRYSDGNSAEPGNQPEERLENMHEYDREFLSQYGFRTKSEFLPYMEHPGFDECWAIFSTMPEDDPARGIFEEITYLQDSTLPSIIMADDFESAWAAYVVRYDSIDYPYMENWLHEQIMAQLAINN